MKEKKINYQKFVEDFASIHYGCLCCKSSGKCKDECYFEMDFSKLIDWINDGSHVDNELDKLNIKDYIIDE